MQWFALPTGVKKSNMWVIQIYAFLIKKSLDQPLWAFPSSKPALYGTIKFNSYNANDKKRMLVLKGANLKKLHILEWHMFKMSFDWWMFLYYTPLRLKIVFSISLVLVFFFFFIRWGLGEVPTGGATGSESQQWYKVHGKIPDSWAAITWPICSESRA